jgi:OH-DDVA oxygenase
MAEIVLGMWSAHGPSLSLDPDDWLLRLPADHKQKNHPFRGKLYDFESLVELRKDEGLAVKSSREARIGYADRCQAAIETMAAKFVAAKPDVAVIFGNDQREMFLEEFSPSLAVFDGPVIWNQPATAHQATISPPGIHEAEWGHNPPERTEYPGHPELAHAIIENAVKDGFDLSRFGKIPETADNWASGIGHAFGYIYRRIMKDDVIPHVPIFANTFYPPNQPPARRCFEFGQSVGRTVRNWNSDARVAVFGSGGMSHFVIDEDFDRYLFDCLDRRDAEALCTIGEDILQSGTSECKNWIAAAGCLFETQLSGGVVGYEPCYRSEAGTGSANGFVCWN